MTRVRYTEPSLADLFPKEMERIEELIKEYDKLPTSAGAFGSVMLKNIMVRAKHAWKSQDVVQMIQAYEEMRQCK